MSKFTNAGSVKLVATDIAGNAVDHRILKRSRVAEDYFVAAIDGRVVVLAGRKRIAHQIAPGRDTSSLAIGTAANFKGMPGLRGCNSRELYAFENLGLQLRC